MFILRIDDKLFEPLSSNEALKGFKRRQGELEEDGKLNQLNEHLNIPSTLS